MNPTPEHKEQAREIEEQWRFSVPRSQIGTVTDPQWDKLIDRIAAALSAKDAEIERLIASFKYAAWKGFNQSDSEFEKGYKHAMTVAATALESLLTKEKKDAGNISTTSED